MKLHPILLVEDDPEDVEIINLALEKSGCPFHFIHVANGADAIRYLSRDKYFADVKKYPVPSMVLLDLSLPGIDGFGVLRWMRGRPDGTVPPAIVISYSDTDRDVRLAHQLGAKYYLIKSVSLDGNIGLIKSVDHFWRMEFSQSAIVTIPEGTTTC